MEKVMIDTRDFGELEIAAEDIVEFPEGMPGFPEHNEFVLLPLKEDSPFIIMQSVEEKGLAFVTIEPGNFFADYEFDLPEEAVDKLQIDSVEEVVVLAIATIKDKLENMTVNLAAPVVINLEARLGKQVILDDNRYPLRYQIFAQSGDEEEGGG